MIVNTIKVFVGKVCHMAEAQEFTVDQLAQDAEIPVSTVRMYQQRGLIDPPEKRGRVGFYNSKHRERLALIASLQDRGFSLAAIKQALDSWETGGSLNELLDVGNLSPSLDSTEIRLDPAELAKRFAGVELTQSDIQRAVEVGLIKIEGTEIVITNGPFLEIGPAVAEAGLPVSVMLDEYETLSGEVEQIAARFREIFENHLWSNFVDDGMPVDEIGQLTEKASQLTQLATATVTAEFNARFAGFVAEYVAIAEAGRDKV